jgi:hypothetical protein
MGKSSKENSGLQHGAFKQSTPLESDKEATPMEDDVVVENVSDSNDKGSGGNKLINLPMFSGELQSMAIGEWLKRWNNYSKASGWTPDVEAVKLLSFTTGKAFSTLTKLGASPSAELQKATLAKVFGLTPEKAFAKLCSKKFIVGEDDTDIFGTSIMELVDISFGNEPITKDKLAKMIFWNSLPQSQESRALQLLQRSVEDRSLEGASDDPEFWKPYLIYCTRKQQHRSSEAFQRFMKERSDACYDEVCTSLQKLLVMIKLVKDSSTNKRKLP